MTLAVGFVMGIVYMLVDYGIFNLLLGTRSISDGHSLFFSASVDVDELRIH